MIKISFLFNPYKYYICYQTKYEIPYAGGDQIQWNTQHLVKRAFAFLHFTNLAFWVSIPFFLLNFMLVYDPIFSDPVHSLGEIKQTVSLITVTLS